MAIRLNMFRFIVRNDFAPRTRNGQPAHRITGVPSANSIHSTRRSPIHSRTGRPSSGPMVRTSSGTVSAAPMAKRRRKSISSGFGPASAVGTIGSSAMPQIGQSPGPSWTISGSIGQV